MRSQPPEHGSPSARVAPIPARRWAPPCELDVTDRRAAQRFVDSALGELGGLDILVNNAGLGLGRDPFWESTDEDEATVIETNVLGLLRMTRLCLPHIRDGGHIVNIGSVAGREPYENAAVYVASKFAVRGFTYALREDLLGRPIHLTIVDPGLVETSSRWSASAATRSGRRSVYEGVEPLTPDGHRRVRALRRHAAAARQRRRDRRQGARAVDPTRIVRDQGLMAITILEGSNFCISDQNGDFSWPTSGLFAYDTRFLSLLELTINGERPLLLSAGKAEYYSAAYFLRNPVAGELPQDSVSIGRHRFVGEGMQDHLILHNQSHGAGRVRARARVRQRLRGHLRGQEPRLRARRPAEGAAPFHRRPRRATRRTRTSS